MNDLITSWFRTVARVGHNTASVICFLLKSIEDGDHDFKLEIFISFS